MIQCEVCDEEQFATPSGTCCINGHGGVGSKCGLVPVMRPKKARRGLTATEWGVERNRVLVSKAAGPEGKIPPETLIVHHMHGPEPGRVETYLGDCLEVLATLPENSIDTCICDPPYGIKFMSKTWDHGVPGVPFWSAVFRVLKPGATLMAFGGTRTYHHLTCAIEDAGFEIRDCVAWWYGSGMGLGANIGKATGDEQWDGWGTKLKAAHEPIVVAMKPLDGTYAANALKHGVAGLHIDGGRVGTTGGTKAVNFTEESKQPGLVSRSGSGKHNDVVKIPKDRWPANVILSHSTGCGDSCTQDCPTQGLSEVQRSYFYTAKASSRERDFGLEGFAVKQAGFPMRSVDKPSDSAGGDNTKTHRKTTRANIHETVKPIAIMRYLMRLTATPTGGVVLDPFMGSGSTGMAAVMEGRGFVGIEKEPEYIKIARARISWAQKQGTGDK